MHLPLVRLRPWLTLLLVFGAACGTTRSAVSPRRPPDAVSASVSTSVQTPATPSPGELYAAEEALRDVRSSPLEFVGEGEWPGLNRLHACAFRNARVIVVNAYCTVTEMPAYRLDVYSPGRGRVRIYAESRGALSAHMRQDYFTFTAESEPTAGPETRVPTVALSMTFEALRFYEHMRYDAFLPACYGGIEHGKSAGGCLGALQPRADEWAARNRPFLEQANSDWYLVLREMRVFARKYGRDPK